MFAARTAVPLCGIWQRGAGSCTQHFKGSREVAIRVISTVKRRTEIRERPPQTKISGGSAPQTPPARSLRSLALVFFFFFKFPFFTFTFFRSTTLEKTPSFFSSSRFSFLFSLCLNSKKIWPCKKSQKNYIYSMRPCATQNFDFFSAFIFWKMRHFLMFCENQTSFCL